MIAFAAALRLEGKAGVVKNSFDVRPRWDLAALS